MKLSTPALKGIFQFSGDIKYGITANGKLVIDQPVYFAVRKAIRMGG
jgi:hypothetical protein